MISVIIPAYHEDGYLNRCLASLILSSRRCPCRVEIITVKNVRGCWNARNKGAREARGDILAFVDADSTVSSNFLLDIYNKQFNSYFIGGGVKFVQLDRVSVGRLLFLMCIGIYLFIHRVTVGAFWVRKESFDILQGFRDQTWDDSIDFALRLKKLAKEQGKKFESLKDSYIIWSTRSFDKYGEWFWLKRYRAYQS